MIDYLAEHESFLRAIYNAPADDTPRLVYADFLEENGDPDRAELIRTQCERARAGRSASGAVLSRGRSSGGVAVEVRLTAGRPRLADPHPHSDRGFPHPVRTAEVSAARLADPAGFREWVVRSHPEYFAATEVRVTAGPIDSAGPLETLFGSLALTRVTRLGLNGEWRWTGRAEEVGDHYRSVTAEQILVVVVTPAGARALAECPGARRLTTLDLTHNGLDDSAARALARSPHLGRLRRLDVLVGNRIGPRARQQLLDRFGPGVVG
jgi:uncharacterized protein (TIGR02996 family)